MSDFLPTSAYAKAYNAPNARENARQINGDVVDVYNYNIWPQPSEY